MSKDKLHVKVLLNIKQAKTKGISFCVGICTWKLEKSLFGLPSECVETADELRRNHTQISINRRCFINPSSQINYIFLSHIIRGKSFQIHPG
jgi:hypothetical protein